MPRDPETTAGAGPELPLACALDAAGMGQQRDRYAALSNSIRSSGRRPLGFDVVFDDTLDVDLLEETLVIERACCPFFGLQWSPKAATLTVSVVDASHEPGLDALAEALRLA